MVSGPEIIGSRSTPSAAVTRVDGLGDDAKGTTLLPATHRPHRGGGAAEVAEIVRIVKAAMDEISAQRSVPRTTRAGANTRMVPR